MGKRAIRFASVVAPEQTRVDYQKALPEAIRITDNIGRYLRHEPLLGVVDPQRGY